MKAFTTLATVLIAACPVFAADPEPRAATTTTTAASATSSGVEEASAAPTLGAQIVQGCFSSWGNLIFNSTPEFNSKSACAFDICYAGKYTVAATSAGNECYCGTEYPPEDTLADDTKCNTPCPGYGLQACGGVNYWTVYNTGISLNVDYAADNKTTSATSSTAANTVVASSTVVSGGQTSVVYVTTTPSGDSDSSKKSSSTNTGAIVAGVVVGVVAVAAALGAIFFFIRRKRNREIEEEHRRNAAVNAFMKPPGSSGGYSVDTDARLDPVMAQRRLSSGSIADNQDYSRRILRVTNA